MRRTSTSVVGRQNLANRLNFFKDFSQPWNMDKSEAEIIIFLKNNYFFTVNNCPLFKPSVLCICILVITDVGFL